MIIPGNVKKVMADAKKIARQIQQGHASIKDMMNKYHCGNPLIRRAIESVMPEGIKRMTLDELCKKQLEEFMAEMEGPEITVWSCMGCGEEFDQEPDGPCPKCLSLRFERFTCRRKAEGRGQKTERELMAV